MKLTRTRFDGTKGIGRSPTLEKAAKSGQTFELGALPPAAKDTNVFARELTAAQFRERIERVKASIYDAADFSMAFTKELDDPLVAKAFVRFMQAIQAGHATVKAQPADKRKSAQVMYSYLEVETFLEQFAATLEAMEQSKAESPVDVSSVGLQVMDRNAQIMANADTPIQMAGVLNEMSKLAGLKPADREKFLTQLADAAIGHVDKQENRTPEGRKQALQQLRAAIRGLVDNDSAMKIINPYLKRAEEISKEQDGDTGRAEQIRTIGLLSFSTSGPTKTRAERALFEHYTALMDLRYEAQDANRQLSGEEIEGFKALLESSMFVPKLFAQMPELIEALTNHPKLADEARRAEEAAAAQEAEAADGAAEADAAEAAPAEGEATADGTEAQVYTPSAAELDAQQQMLTTFLASLQKMFPDISDGEAKAQHISLTRKGNSLILDGMNFDQSANFANQVRQLTRHPDAAMDALDLISVIPDLTHQLDAAKAAVISAIENRNLDAAYDLYHNEVFTEDDGKNLGRQADMLAAVSRVVLETKGDLEGSRPAMTWAGRAHTVGVEQALKANPRNNAALRQILDLLAADWEDWRLPPQDSIEFVAKVEKELKGDENYHEFTPVLVGILAKHEDNVECMDKAKELLDRFRTTMESVAQQPHIQVTVNGAATNVHPQNWFVALLGTLSQNKTLSSFIRPLTETAFQHLAVGNMTVQYARAIPALGKYADKTMLARQLDPHMPNIPAAHQAQIALTLAASAETHQQAREIAIGFAQTHDGIDVQELDNDQRQAFFRVEGAIRMAVPNILTTDALTGLFKGYQSGQVAKEVIELVPMHLPDDLIEKVFAAMPNADELRQIIADKKAALEAPPEEAAAEEQAAE